MFHPFIFGMEYSARKSEREAKKANVTNELIETTQDTEAVEPQAYQQEGLVVDTADASSEPVNGMGL